MPSAEFDEGRLSGLIAHLYDAAVDDALWTGTAARIAGTFGSASAVLKLHGDDTRVDLLECTENLVVPERLRPWAEDWHRRDLWVQRSVAHGMSRIITDQDLVTRDEQARSGFYREWLHDLGIYHMVGAVFPVAKGSTGVIGIHRPRAAGEYAASDRRMAALVLPHLQRALQLGQRLAMASLTRAGALQALDRLDAGVFVVDGAGRIIHASFMAETILRDSGELGVIGGRLAVRNPALHDKLLSLLRGAIGTASGRIARPAAALALPRDHHLPLTLAVAPLRPSVSSLGDQRPCALIFIRDPEAPMAVDGLRDLFSLTRAEAGVAADLGRGCSLEDISRRRGVGLATVRSHLKRILAKTGTHRQAEAVALLARSVPMSPDRR